MAFGILIFTLSITVLIRAYDKYKDLKERKLKSQQEAATRAQEEQLKSFNDAYFSSSSSPYYSFYDYDQNQYYNQIMGGYNWQQQAKASEPEFKVNTYDVEPINRIEDKRT